MSLLVTVKTVLMEYSPREATVFVRGVWAEGKAMTLAPIHEDNIQSYVRVLEGVDNLANAGTFCGLAFGRAGGDPRRAIPASSKTRK